MVQEQKGLLWRDKDLNWTPRTHVKGQVQLQASVIPSRNAGERQVLGPCQVASLVELVSSGFSERPSISKRVWPVTEEDT